MSLKHISLSLIALLLCGWFFSDGFYSSEEQQIRRTFREMLDHASIQGGTPPLEKIFTAKRLARYFDRHAEGVLSLNGQRVGKLEKFSVHKLENMLLAAYRDTHEMKPKVLLDRYEQEDQDKVLYSKFRVYGSHREPNESFLEEFEVKLFYKQNDQDNNKSPWVIKKLEAKQIKRFDS